MTAATKLKDTCSWKKSYDKPRQHIRRQSYHFTDKGPYNHNMVCPVVMYRYENFTRKKTRAKKLILSNCGAGEDLRAPWTARRSNQSILKEINT